MSIDVKTGDTLIHPVHGEMTVTNVSPNTFEEFIPAVQRYETGHQIEAVFQGFIPEVKWSVTKPGGRRVSKLIFHSWYLRNLKRKDG